MTPQTAAQIIRNHGWPLPLCVSTHCGMDERGDMISNCSLTGYNRDRTDICWFAAGADVGFALIRAIIEVDGYNRKVEVEAQKANDELLNLISERV